MTVEQHDVVDFISINAGGDVVLTVSDHLSWDQVNEHLFCIQEKLNGYQRFVESGEIISSYPNAAGGHIVIDVVLKYPARQEASWFFERTSEAINGGGFGFSMRHTAAPTN
jgi:hypothetical protein